MASDPDRRELEQLLDAFSDGKSSAADQVYLRLQPALQDMAQQKAGGIPPGFGVTVEDLAAEGVLGIVLAVKSYEDGWRGDFRALALELAGKEMDNALEDATAQAADTSQLIADAELLEAAEIRLGREYGRPATPLEIRTDLNWAEDRMDEVAASIADAREQYDKEMLAILAESDVELDPSDFLGADGPDEPATEGPSASTTPPTATPPASKLDSLSGPGHRQPNRRPAPGRPRRGEGPGDGR